MCSHSARDQWNTTTAKVSGHGGVCLNVTKTCEDRNCCGYKLKTKTHRKKKILYY